MNIIKKLILFLSIFSLIQITYAQNIPSKVTIRGKITDSQTGETLPGASVLIKDTTTGATSDVQGNYTLSLEKGSYIISFAYMGYETQEINVNANTSQTIDIKLNSNAQELTEVVVSSRKKDENVTSTNMGVEKMNIKEIQLLPALAGEVDVLKVVQLLPGVQATSEGSSGFSVRGGSPDQNLILLDNTTVYNASHLLGFFSVFNNDVISGLELYKGDIPAKYGGRLSSLLSIKTKSEMPSRFQGTGGLGLISSRLMLEGPMGGRTSWMIGARRSYADLFLKLSGDEAMSSASIYFYDMNAKLFHRFTSGDNLELNAYYGKDVFGADKVLKFDYGNLAGSLTWRHIFSENLYSKFSINVSNYDYGTGMESDGMSTDWTGRIFDVAFKFDFNQHINRWWNLNYGLSTIVHRINPGDVTMSNYTDYKVQSTLALENDFYISNEQQLTDKLSARYGIRLSFFQNVGETTMFRYNNQHQVIDSVDYTTGHIYYTYTEWEPRAGLVYLFDNQSSVKANYARNAQYLQLAENSASGSPFNVWFSASPNIKPQTVDMFSLGYFRNFSDNMFETSVEVYYKSMHNVIDFADHAKLLLNPYLEGEVRTGKGRAYGVEFTVKKKSGKLTGFVNYTLSRSERTISEINDGKTYLAPYDKPHVVNISLNYKFSKKWNASALWVFSTGTPTTYPTGRFEINGEYFPIYSGRNEYRKPNYHRLDLSVNYIPNPDSKKRWKGEWNFSIYNAYARKNAWIINYNQADTPTPTAEMTYLFGIIPSITYNFKF
ncbi:MAG: TonB-dependent receptor [Bacteroidales bacterium]|nr:TonB-dependent receptor [Bacteroidales bacterium]